MTFHDRLALAMGEVGIGRKELDTRLKCGASTVSEWWTRGVLPSGELMLRLPKAIRKGRAPLSLDWLATGRGGMFLGGDSYAAGVEAERKRLKGLLET